MQVGLLAEGREVEAMGGVRLHQHRWVFNGTIQHAPDYIVMAMLPALQPCSSTLYQVAVLQA